MDRESAVKPRLSESKTTGRRRLLGSFRLMFGRHAGKPIRTIPFAYLRWAVSADGDIPAPDRWAIRQYLKEVRGRASGKTAKSTKRFSSRRSAK